MMKKILPIFFILTISCNKSDTILLSEKNLDFSLSKQYLQSPENFEFINQINVDEIIYKSDGLKIHGYLAQPKKQGKYPVIIFCRGGNRGFGELTKDNALGLGGMASNGYVVIASNYRGSSKSEGLDEFGGKDVNDIIALFDVIKELKNADTTKIALIGGSRGGMMIYLTLKQLRGNKNIKTAVITAGATDLELIFKNRPEMEKSVAAQLIPNYWKNKDEEIRKRSVINWIDSLPKHVPILLFHGTEDWRVSVENAYQLDNKLTKIDFPHQLITYPNANHYLEGFRSDVISEREKWLNKYLK